MAQVDITLVDRGDRANDGTGDGLRTAFGKLNDNDTALKAAIEDVETGGAPAEHTHTLSDITDAGTAAAADSTDFAAANHTHTLSDITDAGTAAASDTGDFAAAGHSHTLSDITDAGTAASSDADDFASATSTLTEVTGNTTLTNAHLGHTILYDGDSDITLTVASDAADGWYGSVINNSEKEISFAVEGTDTLLPDSAKLYPAANGVSAASLYHNNGTVFVITADQPTEPWVVVCSAPDTDLTTGTAVARFRMPYPFLVTDVRAGVGTAPSGAAIQVDINEGDTSILSTVITIDDGDTTSLDATTAPVISDNYISLDSEVKIDIDQVGSSTAGKDLVVTILGYQVADRDIIVV